VSDVNLALLRTINTLGVVIPFPQRGAPAERAGKRLGGQRRDCAIAKPIMATATSVRRLGSLPCEAVDILYRGNVRSSQRRRQVLDGKEI
jgi:hypothetical protein